MAMPERAGMSSLHRAAFGLPASLAAAALLALGGCGLPSIGSPAPADVAAYLNDQRAAADLVKGMTPREYLTASIVYSNQKCKEFFIALAEADRKRQLVDTLLSAASAAGASLFPVVSASTRDLAVYTISIAGASAINDGINQIYGFASYGNEIANKVTEAQNVYLSATSTRDSIRVVSAYSTRELRGQIRTSLSGNTFAPIPTVNLVINIDQVTRDEAFLLARYVAQGYAYQCSVASINAIVRGSIATARIGNHASGGRGGFFQALPGPVGSDGPPGTGGRGTDGPGPGGPLAGGGNAQRPGPIADNNDTGARPKRPQPAPDPKDTGPTQQSGNPTPSDELGAITTVERGLTSAQIITLQNNLCVAADGKLGPVRSPTRMAIENYQTATGQRASGTIDTDVQLNDIRNSPSCLLPRDPRSAYHKFYLAGPQRQQRFHADLLAAMRYIATSPPGLARRVDVPPRLTERSLDGDVDAPLLTRQAIRLIEEARGISPTTGILDPRNLAAVIEYGSRVSPNGSQGTGQKGADPGAGPASPQTDPAPAPTLNAVEARLSSEQVRELQRKLCLQPDGNRSFAPSLREAIRNYQSATDKPVTGSLDDNQLKEIRASPVCTMDTGSAFAKFHLRTDQRLRQFHGELAGAMRALAPSKPVIAQQGLTQVEGQTAFNRRTRQAIEVIQEHIGITRTGHLDKRVLDAIKVLTAPRN